MGDDGEQVGVDRIGEVGEEEGDGLLEVLDGGEVGDEV